MCRRSCRWRLSRQSSGAGDLGSPRTFGAAWTLLQAEAIAKLCVVICPEEATGQAAQKLIRVWVSFSRRSRCSFIRVVRTRSLNIRWSVANDGVASSPCFHADDDTKSSARIQSGSTWCRCGDLESYERCSRKCWAIVHATGVRRRSVGVGCHGGSRRRWELRSGASRRIAGTEILLPSLHSLLQACAASGGWRVPLSRGARTAAYFLPSGPTTGLVLAYRSDPAPHVPRFVPIGPEVET